MTDFATRQLHEHLEVVASLDVESVTRIGEALIDCFASGGTLYTFGNGGSAADAQHLVGELIGHYCRDRRPLPAATLTTDPTVITCVANDYSFDKVFSRQVAALAKPGDVVVAFTTSGRSPNVVRGLEAARKAGATTILFAGGDGGPCAEHADITFLAASSRTPRIQEVHTMVLHIISETIDAWADETDKAAAS